MQTDIHTNMKIEYTSKKEFLHKSQREMILATMTSSMHLSPSNKKGKVEHENIIQFWIFREMISITWVIELGIKIKTIRRTGLSQPFCEQDQ